MPKTKDWEKEFREKFVWERTTKEDVLNDLNPDEIMDWIAKHLSRAVAKERTQIFKEVREKVIPGTDLNDDYEYANPIYGIARKDLKKEQLKKLKELEEVKNEENI